MISVLRILQPFPRPRCGSAGRALAVDSPAVEMPRARCSSPAALAIARGNFTLCLQGRKTGLTAAKANRGQSSISNTRVKSEENVRLDSRLKNGVRRSGGDAASNCQGHHG